MTRLSYSTGFGCDFVCVSHLPFESSKLALTCFYTETAALRGKMETREAESQPSLSSCLPYSDDQIRLWGWTQSQGKGKVISSLNLKYCKSKGIGNSVKWVENWDMSCSLINFKWLVSSDLISRALEIKIQVVFILFASRSS